MGIKRGTVLAFMGIGGWLVEKQLSLLWNGILSVLQADFVPVAVPVVTLPESVAWSVGCVLGIVAGDIFTHLVGDDVALGKWAGIGKGMIAASVGALGLHFGDGSFLWFVASIWLSTVCSDLIGL